MPAYACKRSADAEDSRLAKRVATTLDTTLREIYGLPKREELRNPKPVSLQTCIDFLTAVTETSTHGRARTSSTYTAAEQ